VKLPYQPAGTAAHDVLARIAAILARGAERARLKKEKKP
jgi:hypothetical protein